MKFLVKPVLLAATLLVGLPTASALADNGRDHRRSDRHHDHRGDGWRGDRGDHRHWNRGDRGWRGYDRSYYYAAPRYYRPPPVYYVRPYDPYYYDPYGVQFTWNIR